MSVLVASLNLETCGGYGSALKGMELVDFAIANGYNYIGTQELRKPAIDAINNNISNYKAYGKFRRDVSLYRKFPILRKVVYNESTAIITNKKVINTSTHVLPWLPRNISEIKATVFDHRLDIIPTIMTEIRVKDNELGAICHLNCHLNYSSKGIQKRELKSLLSHINKVPKKYKIILTGDFNMEVGNKNFDLFIDELSKKKIVRVPINDKTNGSIYPNKTAIDHIFISEDFKVLEYGIIKNDILDKMTDHKGIYAKIESFDLKISY